MAPVAPNKPPNHQATQIQRASIERRRRLGEPSNFHLNPPFCRRLSPVDMNRLAGLSQAPAQQNQSSAFTGIATAFP